MQVGSFGDDRRPHDAGGLVARINALAENVRACGGVVVFVQHDGPHGDAHEPGQPGWELLAELDRRPSDAVIRKTACDCFHDTGLEALLTSNAVDTVIYTGSATDYCVDTTIRAAALKPFGVWAPSDGHTTIDRPHLSARQIIAHHNSIWSDLIAPRSLRVASCAELTATLCRAEADAP